MAPSSILFLYFQIQHAASSQFHELTVQWPNLPLEDMLSSSNPQKLISLYLPTLRAAHAAACSTFRKKWEAVVPDPGNLGGGSENVDVRSNLI